MFSLAEIVGENFMMGYKLAEIQTRSLNNNIFQETCYMFIIAAFMDFVWYELPQNYLYTFYRESFFDRNWFLLILPAYFFRLFKGNPLIYIALTLILILVNEPFRRWRMRKRAIAAEKTKNLLEHPHYDATKVKLKHYTKNFFIRSWFMFVIPWLLITVIGPSIKGMLYRLMLIVFSAFEAFCMKAARKEIKEMLGEENFIDFTDES